MSPEELKKAYESAQGVRKMQIFTRIVFMFLVAVVMMFAMREFNSPHFLWLLLVMIFGLVI